MSITHEQRLLLLERLSEARRQRMQDQARQNIDTLFDYPPCPDEHQGQTTWMINMAANEIRAGCPFVVLVGRDLDDGLRLLELLYQELSNYDERYEWHQPAYRTRYSLEYGGSIIHSCSAKSYPEWLKHERYWSTYFDPSADKKAWLEAGDKFWYEDSLSNS